MLVKLRVIKKLTLFDVICFRAPRELKSDVVRCLASVGYIVVQESPTRFMLWILSKLAESSSDEVKICLFESVLQVGDSG